MTFEKTKAAATAHSEEEVTKETELQDEEDTSAPADEEGAQNDTQAEDDTSINDDESDESLEDDDDVGAGDENSVAYWKAKAEKAEEEKANYQQGMIAAKAKKRSAAGVDGDGEKSGSVSEQQVVAVLEKQNERKALREVIDPRSTNYMPELVDDNQYNEILGYLPRNLDKSSPDGIYRALKLAIKSWKDDKGIKTKPQTNKKAAELAATRTSTSSGIAPQHAAVKGERKILKKRTAFQDWYQ